MAQPHEIGVRLLVEPTTADDELFAKISDVSDRSAEAANAQLEEGQENIEGRTCLPLFSASGGGRDQIPLRYFVIHVTWSAYA